VISHEQLSGFPEWNSGTHLGLTYVRFETDKHNIRLTITENPGKL